MGHVAYVKRKKRLHPAQDKTLNLNKIMPAEIELGGCYRGHIFSAVCYQIRFVSTKLLVLVL